MKLGRLPAKHDKRSLNLRDYWPVTQVAAPPSLRDWSAKADHNWQWYANASLSTCVPASFAHLVQVWSSMNGNEIEPSEDDVVTAYRSISGYDGSPHKDVGCSMLDAMKYWRSYGIGSHKILAYVSIDPQNQLELEAAINLFGGVSLGADMPVVLRDSVTGGSKATWDVAPANHWSPEYRPGSWGGHAMACVGYSRSYATLVTWGRTQVVTRNWARTYCSEGWAAISEDWVTATRAAPNGFDLDALERSLAALA